MLEARLSTAADDAAWDAFVASHPHGHLLQASAWGRFRARWGWLPRRVVVEDAAGRLCAGAQLLVRSTPLGDVTYVPRGPVCRPMDEAWPVLRAAMADVAGQGIALRIEPNWPDEASVRTWLHALGYRETEPVQPASTIVVDVCRDDDTLLAAMKQKWRYNVRLAERRGVAVRLVGAGGLGLFGQLMKETAARNRFGARPADYYADAWQEFGAAARLYVAQRNGESLAAIMVFHFGAVATYLYGASTRRGRRHMPNHLLQWAAIRGARDDGCSHYDLWGVPDEIGRAVVAGRSPSDVAPRAGGLWGVWAFKRGFGGRVQRSVGAWDEVYAPARYRAGTLASRVRALLGR